MSAVKRSLQLDPANIVFVPEMFNERRKNKLTKNKKKGWIKEIERQKITLSKKKIKNIVLTVPKETFKTNLNASEKID